MPGRYILSLFLLSTSLLRAQAPDPAQKILELEAKIAKLEERLEELDQRFRVADRKEEIRGEEVAAKAKLMPTVTADANSGVAIKSSDSNFTFKFGGDFQIDNRTFFEGNPATGTDQILMRRVRPTFSGSFFKYFDYYIRPDFGQGSTVLYEAYGQINYVPRAALRFGKFKPPVGLERLQSDDDSNFMERGLPTLLVPSRDIGYQISGDIVKRRVSYAVGVFNGVADNGLADVSSSDHRDYAGRIFLTPFLPNAKHPLSGLGFGIGASSGNVDNIPLPSFKSFGQNTFLAFASGVTSAGHRTRLAPQAYYYVGSFGLLAEYTLNEQGFQKGTASRDIAFRAWQIQTSYLLTGEKKGFTTLTPKKAFDPRNHAWGAVELAVRVGDFSAEQGLYNYGFALATDSPRRAHEWAGGVNWYLNRMLRISIDYGNTNYEGGAAVALGGNRPSERVLLNRFQINF